MKVKSIMKMYFLVFVEQPALELNAVSAKNGKGKHILKRVNIGPNGRLAASVCARTGRTPGGRTANRLVYAAGQLLECVRILIRKLKIVQYGVKARPAGITVNRAAARIPVDSTWHPAGQRAGMRVTVQQLDKRPRRLQIHTSLHTLYILRSCAARAPGSGRGSPTRLGIPACCRHKFEKRHWKHHPVQCTVCAAAPAGKPPRWHLGVTGNGVGVDHGAVQAVGLSMTQSAGATSAQEAGTTRAAPREP